ncbi:conserved putative superfamily II helicase [Tokyovirus A1]|uniref:conserved putative superfamily II helicase n=1 Tax=Tokyovirus A1 TaxID=1826170 RepID=UPI0007A97810|nr:conserved putative superfamily II helicase [Tokyovirus A1]BAU80186.1 conserved putative superfamily II helicase [Tokyovirus A1]
MSFRVSKALVSREKSKLARKLCSLTPIATKYNPAPQEIRLFKAEGEEYVLPLATWKKLELPKPEKRGQDISGEFIGELLEETKPAPGRHTKRDQQTIFERAKELIDRESVCLLSLSTGIGKTCLGICLASHYGGKTLVLCKSNKVKRQWVESVQKFTNHSVEIVKGETLPDADFYIMGPMKCRNFKGDLSCFRTVIVDECHEICTSVFSEALFKVHPSILIGLSATPDRMDGLGEMLPPFFGENPIVRKEKKEFKVYKILTGFVPNRKYDKRGTLIWTEILRSLAENKERQKLITKVLQRPSEGKTIVLGKRKAELRALSSLLGEAKVSNTLYIEGAKTYDDDASVILTTVGKGGVGMDDSKIKTVAIISDAMDVRQYEGRARGANSIVYDFVDKHSTLEKHWRERESWYLERGATIEVVNLRSFV